MDGIRRKIGHDLPELLVQEQVVRGQFQIRLAAARPQEEASRGVKRVVAANVRPGPDGANEGIDLRFRQGVIPGAEDANAPFRGEV